MLVGANSGLRNTEVISMCVTVDALPPYLLAASPTSANFNAKRLWFSFAFSEPILLLYDPLHSFTENLQTSTAERLLSMICSPGQVGECISVAGGTVLSAAVEADRIALELAAAQKSRLSVLIPRALLTDLAGNALRSDVRQAVTVNDDALEVTRWATVLFARRRFRPFLALTFNKPTVHVAATATIVVTVQQAAGNVTRVVGSQDVIVNPYTVVFDVDEAYRAHAKYDVMIPAGMFSDEYANFFAGYMGGQLAFSSGAMRPFLVLLTLGRFWLFFAVCAVGVGVFLAVAGYRQVYYAVLLNNALFFLLLLALAVGFFYLLFFPLHTWVLLPLLLVLAVAAVTISSGLSHHAPSTALRAFTASLGCYAGAMVFRVLCDALSDVTGFVTLYLRSQLLICRVEFYLLLLLPVATTVGGCFVALSSQRAFIAAIAFAASVFCVSVVDVVLRRVLRRKEVLVLVGDSVLYDGVGVVLVLVLMYVVYHTQKKVEAECAGEV